MRAARWWFSDVRVIAGRHLRRIANQPDALVLGQAQAVMFIVLFVYVFGGVIERALPGGDYAQYLMSGIFVQTAVFSSLAGVSLGMSEDLHTGLMDRFRSLPMTRSAILLGHLAADVVRNVFALALMLPVSFAVGFRWHGTPLGALSAAGLVLLLAFAGALIAAVIALTVASVQAAQSAATLAFFPLTFASSTFAPVETMPRWLEAFAAHNPVTLTVDALRALVEGEQAGAAGWQSFAWSAGLTVVVVPLAVLKFRQTAGRRSVAGRHRTRAGVTPQPGSVQAVA